MKIYSLSRFKNGQEVRADARLKITRDTHRTENYSLTLNLLKEEDSGDYEVKVTNSMGTVASMSHVHVQSKYRYNRVHCLRSVKSQSLLYYTVKYVSNGCILRIGRFYTKSIQLYISSRHIVQNLKWRRQLATKNKYTTPPPHTYEPFCQLCYLF
jgi:Immunoglobulin I-set domain